MFKSTPRQRRTEGRFTHEFKHSELESAQGGKNAKARTAAGKPAAQARVQGAPTCGELYAKAKKRHIPNPSKMTKTQLENALA